MSYPYQRLFLDVQLAKKRLEKVLGPACGVVDVTSYGAWLAEPCTTGPRDIRSVFPRFTSDARKANQPIVDLLCDIGRRKKVTPAQIALAWLLAQKPWIVPIPGTRKLERLNENLGAVAIELTPDDLREIDTATSNIKVQGARGTGQEQYL